MTSNEIVEQLKQILEMLRRTIEASGELAQRVELLEEGSGEKLGVLTSLQGNLKVLLETYQAHAEAQSRTNLDVAESIKRLEERIVALEKEKSQHRS